MTLTEMVAFWLAVQAGEIVPVKNHPDYYVSMFGYVYSTKKDKLHRLKSQPDQDGYLHVVLCTDSKPYTIKIQRLVALHFIGPKPEGEVVCHNDGDKANCHVENLRYDTQAANIADKVIHGTNIGPQGEVNGMSKLAADDVLELRRLRAEDNLTQRELGQRFGISREHARDIVNRKSWQHI